MTVIEQLNNHILSGYALSYAQLNYFFMDFERYANDGSPSGFNDGVAFEYNPFNSKKYFKLPVYLTERLDHVQIGQLPPVWAEDISHDNNLPIPIHPEVLQIILSSCPSLAENNKVDIDVEPTSSGRTVLWGNEGKEAIYIKLHFPKLIGRFPRDLSIYKWLSALEKSKEFYINCNKYPSYIGFLYDFGGIFYIDKKTKASFGTIFREFMPRPKISDDLTMLFPAFSLIAKSYNKTKKNNLLNYIINFFGTDKKLFLGLFIEPLIKSYLYLSLKIGLIPECNAQNVLFEINFKKKKTRVIYRDLGDTFVDHEIRQKNKMHTMFCSYKSLDGVFSKDIFQRRSFAYDFKLSYYIIKPLIDRYADLTSHSNITLYHDVKNIFYSNINDSQGYFGSNIYWYSYPNEHHVSRDSYIRNTDPLFR